GELPQGHIEVQPSGPVPIKAATGFLPEACHRRELPLACGQRPYRLKMAGRPVRGDSSSGFTTRLPWRLSMRTAFPLVLASLVSAAPALAADRPVPQSTLASVGLSGLETMSDAQGDQVRGMHPGVR